MSTLATTAEAQAGLADVASSANVANSDRASGGLAWLDFDADGDLDVVVNTDERSFLFESDGASPPVFRDVTITHALGLGAVSATDGSARSILAADLDHDGYVDIVRGRAGRTEVFLNRGPMATPPYSFGDDAQLATFFVDDTSAIPFAYNAEGAGVLDVNGDGWLDIVIQNDTGVRVFRNPADGTPDFDLSSTELMGVPTINETGEDPDAGVHAAGDYLAVADFDVDGLVDLAVRTHLGPDLYRQTMPGRFMAIEPDLPAPNDNKGGIVFCDFDSDGDLDYLFSDGLPTDAGTNRIWLNDGGSFTRSAVSITGTDIDGLDCGDLDNDGDLDLLVSGTGEKVAHFNTLNASGMLGFTTMTIGGTAGNGEGCALADYDRDGDLDAMVVQDGTPNLLLANDTNDDNYLVVRILADVGSCAERGPVLRDDIGAVAILRVGAVTVGAREVNGGQGHGQQGTPLLHFGLSMGPTTEHELEVRFQHGGGTATVRVTPSALGAYQKLDVVSTDPDGDGILTADEMRDAAGEPDLDGDGLAAWVDPDADGDGVPDYAEAGDRDPCTPAVDLDADGTPDYLQPTPLAVDGGAPVLDGGAPGMDGGAATVDGGATTLALEAHGSGCARCGVDRAKSDRRGLDFALALLALAVLRRRRRRARRSTGGEWRSYSSSLGKGRTPLDARRSNASGSSGVAPRS